MTKFKFEAGDQILWEQWSFFVSFAGSMPFVGTESGSVYVLHPSGGDLEPCVRCRSFVEETAILEKAAGSKEVVGITKDGDYPPPCPPRLTPPCIEP